MNRSRGLSRFGKGAAALCAVFFFAGLIARAHRPAVASHAHEVAGPARSRALDDFAHLPLGFEPNQGQLGHGVNFVARGGGFEAFLDPAGATLMVGSPLIHPRTHSSSRKLAVTDLSRIRMTLAGASRTAVASAADLLPGVVNYYQGHDRSKWRHKIPMYRRAKYAEVYRGIDLAYYGNRGSFEFDFALKPGADANQITLAFEGIDQAEIASDGGAILRTPRGTLTLKRPVAYQEIAGARRMVTASYRIIRSADHAKGPRIAVALGEYDRSRALTIDPVLIFSTLFGGTTSNINGVAIDAGGNVYVTGFAFDCATCFEFPSTGGQVYAGAIDAFIAKINTNSASLSYATLIGGSNFDEGKAVAVDGGGNAYMTGVTFSTDFPQTVGPSSAPGNGDGFVAKFSAGGLVTWASYLGGDEFDEPFGLAIAQGCASNCEAIVVGQTESADFPGASGFTGGDDAFVTEMSADGSAVVYTKLIAGSLGPTGAGSAITFATGVAVDNGGVAFVAGGTDATDFPKTTGPAFAGASDAFAAKLNSNGSVSYARLLGGSDYDQAEGIALKPNCTEPCSAYVEGVTFSSDFPTTGGTVQTSLSGASAQFIAELSGDGSTSTYSTLLGVSGSPVFAQLDGIAVDTAGDAYVIATTTSTSFALNGQVESAPNPNGALYGFQEGPPGPSPTAAPTRIAWPKSNGSPLSIQSDSGTVVVVGSTTGLFISSDGVNFTQATATGLPSGPVTAVDYESGLTPSVIFASVGNSVYVSTNMGASFTASGLAKAAEVIVDLPGGTLSDTQVLVGTVNNGLWSSTDGGTTFAQVASVPATATVFALAANGHGAPGQVFAGTSRGVYTSANLGASFPGTWTATNLNMSAVASMTSDRNSTPPVDYAGTFFQGLYESTDNFNSFVRADVQQFSYSAIELDRDNSTTPATVFAGVNALNQANVYQNSTGYQGAFTDTNFTNLPGNVKGLKNPYVGELLQYHPIVAELNPAGTQVLFSSYLGGSSFDTPGGIAVDAAGANIYVAGTTYSSDFPQQGTQLTGYHGFANGFISKLGPSALATASATRTPTPTATATAQASPTMSGLPTPSVLPTPPATPTATPTPLGAGKIAVAPARLSLRPVGLGVMGASSTAKLTIRNLGKVVALAGDISITNGQPGTAFTVSQTGPYAIAVHGSPIVLTVTYVPDGLTDAATITITSNDAAKSTINVPLSGKGLAGKAVVSPHTITFISRGVGEPVMKTLTLRNAGKGVLMGTITGGSDPFTGAGGSGTLAPGMKDPIQITFTPTSTTPVTQTLQVTAQAPSTGTTTVTLKGIVKVKK